MVDEEFEDFDEFEEMIKQAKVLLIRTYEHQVITERKWLEADLDSYKSKNHRIRVLVLEGVTCQGLHNCELWDKNRFRF